MTDRNALKSMLNSLINDKQEEASLDLHNYINDKMKTIAGIGRQVEEPVNEPVVTNEE